MHNDFSNMSLKQGGGGDLETEYDQVEDLWKLGSLQRKFNQFFVGELFQYFPTFKKNSLYFTDF